MIIKKVEFSRNNRTIIIFTSAFPNRGFNFNLKEIVNRDDLIIKIKQRINEETNKIQLEKTAEAKYNQLKSLEGTEL